MAALAGEDAAAQLPACRTSGERSAQFTGCKPRHDTLVDAGRGGVGQHVALNVVCRRGMRAEAEGSCTCKHSALEGGEGGLDADHACEALQALTRRLQGGAAAAHCCMTLITKLDESRFRAAANRPQAQTPNPFAVLFLRGG